MSDFGIDRTLYKRYAFATEIADRCPTIAGIFVERATVDMLEQGLTPGQIDEAFIHAGAAYLIDKATETLYD